MPTCCKIAASFLADLSADKRSLHQQQEVWIQCLPCQCYFGESDICCQAIRYMCLACGWVWDICRVVLQTAATDQASDMILIECCDARSGDSAVDQQGYQWQQHRSHLLLQSPGLPFQLWS